MRSRVPRIATSIATSIGMATLLTAAAPALAQVVLDVQVVHGSNEIEKASLDPECAEIERRLPMKFKSLQMVRRQQMKLGFGEPGNMTLPSGRQMRVLPISIVKDRLHLHFQMPDVVDTRLQMRTGHPVIVGGEPYDKGQIIIMVTPSFTPQEQPKVHRVKK